MINYPKKLWAISIIGLLFFVVWGLFEFQPIKVMAESQPAAGQCQVTVSKTTVAPGEEFTVTVVSQDPAGVAWAYYFDSERDQWSSWARCDRTDSCTKTWKVSLRKAGTHEYKGGFYNNRSVWYECGPALVTVEGRAVTEDPEATEAKCTVEVDKKVVNLGERFNLKITIEDSARVNYVYYRDVNWSTYHSCGNVATCTKSFALSKNVAGTHEFSGAYYDSSAQFTNEILK